MASSAPATWAQGVGRVLHATGLDVLAALEGRSQLTRDRAIEAGFRDAGSVDGLVSQADIVLSILVPSEAGAVAEQVAGAMERTGAKPVFVECNAIAPKLLERSSRRSQAAQPSSTPESSAAAAGARWQHTLLLLRAGHVRVRGAERARTRRQGCRAGDWPGVRPEDGLRGFDQGHDGAVDGAAYRGARLGLEGTLLAEFGEGHSLARQQMNGIPSMPRRARRWVGEMEEIAATFSALGLTPNILTGAADMYRFVADTPLAEQTSRDPDPTLDEVLGTPAGRLNGHLGNVPNREPLSF